MVDRTSSTTTGNNDESNNHDSNTSDNNNDTHTNNDHNPFPLVLNGGPPFPPSNKNGKCSILLEVFIYIYCHS